MKIKKPKTNGALSSFNAQAFLDTAGVARKVIDYRRGESIYSQGDAADNVMYIQKGGVKLSVVNGSGKEAVVAMFGPSDFFLERDVWRARPSGWARPPPSRRPLFL
jgi:CRP-like cAMP-binding protein